MRYAVASILDELQAQAEDVSLAMGHGRTFLILSGPSAGLNSTGTLQWRTLLDPPSELGPDPREAWVLDIPFSDPSASILNRGDQLKELPEGTIWEVIAIAGGDKISRSLVVKKVEAIDT